MCTYDPEMDRIKDGDGAAVSVYWLDGYSGLFSQRQEASGHREQSNNPEKCLLTVTFSPEAYDQVSTNGPTGWVRLATHLIGEEIIAHGVVLTVEAAGGPVAWTAFLCHAYTSTSALTKIAELGTDERAVRFRSVVSLSRKPDGQITLYNFEGSPGVVDEQGQEVAAASGEAIDFDLSGAVGTPQKRAADAESLALRELIAQQPGPKAPTFAESGFTAPPGEEENPAGAATPSNPAIDFTPTGGGVRWLALMLICAAALLLGLALLAGVIVFWRGRSRPGAAWWVWLLIILITLCAVCLCLAGGLGLLQGDVQAFFFPERAAAPGCLAATFSKFRRLA